jgi:hypothetical protein
MTYKHNQKYSSMPNERWFRQLQHGIDWRVRSEGKYYYG